MVRQATPKLDKLIARVQRLTRAAGARCALAEVLKVSPQHLNHWLSGSREPGGEITLTLEKWATAAEAKQKKTPGVLRAHPAKPRPRENTINEKTEPRPRKK